MLESGLLRIHVLLLHMHVKCVIQTDYITIHVFSITNVDSRYQLASNDW